MKIQVQLHGNTNTNTNAIFKVWPYAMHAMPWACVTCVGGQFWPERLWTWLSGKTLLFSNWDFQCSARRPFPVLEILTCQNARGGTWSVWVGDTGLGMWPCSVSQHTKYKKTYKYKDVEIQMRKYRNTKSFAGQSALVGVDDGKDWTWNAALAQGSADLIQGLGLQHRGVGEGARSTFFCKKK